MQLYTLDPMLDRRWADFVAVHPRASVFHQQGWLNALARTYKYRPLVLTSAPPGKRLSDGIGFCEVDSWITGSRLVSLPFADHSEPLLEKIGDHSEFTEWMRSGCRKRNWKYIELRPLSWEMRSASVLAASESFWFHILDLAPSIEQIFRGLHKNCLQRRIQRAERQHLSYEKGCSDGLVNDFYRLLVITRRRHELLPQPRAWFRNLLDCMSPNVEIRLARNDGIPIAAMLTLHHRGTVVYKYGCSNQRFHHLGATPWLFWKLIEESKDAGFEQIDFGRTDLDNDGLIAFKDRFGTTRRQITYLRYPQSSKERSVAAKYLPSMRPLFSVLPTALSTLAGSLLYRHIG
jgi:CelD/BcsL family acetyltransferase involved in cellulose biosynthesis